MDTTEVAKAVRLRRYLEMVRECESSGKSISEWCRERGVKRSTYYRWQQKARAEMEQSMRHQNEVVELEEMQESLTIMPPAEAPSEATAISERKKHYAQRVMECRSSGKPIRIWCKENGIGVATFYRWQKEAREDLLKIMRGLKRAIPQPPAQESRTELAKFTELPLPAEPPQDKWQLESRELSPVQPAAVVPSGWAICQPAQAADSPAKEITIEIGKSRITATADTDPALLLKVCQVLVAL